MISSDGFRFGYQFKTVTPNIDRLIASETEADRGLIPVFPTLTLLNHCSLATGLYPISHGIVNNYFINPASEEVFSKMIDPKWWWGEPLWLTVTNHGLKAAAYYRLDREVKKGNWTCPPNLCPKFVLNNLTSFEERVDTLLGYFDLEDVPSLMMLYLHDPDEQGHSYVPDDPRITDSVANVDRTIGRPPENVSSAYVVAKMKEGLSSGKVENGKYLKIYLREEQGSQSVEGNMVTVTGPMKEGFFTRKIFSRLNLRCLRATLVQHANTQIKGTKKQ
ncbi:hypothetical protein Sjap_019850 [Stephania japonica]|uniref:Uncharacterized protein n=1 Tax=Stephania japonica TaxID=461633 RepID=A0AAP0F0Y5_9MAGN